MAITKIRFPNAPSGSVVYTEWRNLETNTVWNFVDVAADTYDEGAVGFAYADYALILDDDNDTLPLRSKTIPGSLAAAKYLVTYKIRSAGSAVPTDPVIGWGTERWDGSSLREDILLDSSGQVTVGAMAAGAVTAAAVAAGAIDADALAASAVTSIQAGLATAASLTTVGSNVTSIKAKTDSLTFTVSSVLDVNLQYVNDVVLTGNGVSPTKFGV